MENKYYNFKDKFNKQRTVNLKYITSMHYQDADDCGFIFTGTKYYQVSKSVYDNILNLLK